MTAELDPERYVYVTVPAPRNDLEALAYVREAEGHSYVVPEPVAGRLGLESMFACRRITLGATELDEVGIIARIASVLADAGIACNPIAGYHHDHLLVPADRADAALALLDASS